MPQNWKKYKLSEITTKIGSGSTPRGGKEAYKESGISLIRSQNVLDYSFSLDGLAFIDNDQADKLKNVEIESRDVLLNITGDSVSRVCQVPDEWIPARVNQHVAIIRANKDVLSPEFLKYTLLSKEKKEYLLTLASAGATRNALTKSMIEDFEVSIPKVNEQRAIASILSALDDKIELNLQMNKTLEEMAMALYKHWFVDFGPFQNGEFVDSELGKIPKGWEVKSVGDVTEVVSKGTTPRKKDIDGLDCKIPFLKVKDVSDDGLINESKLEIIPEEVHLKQLKRSILKEDDILFSIAGTIGRVSIVPKTLDNANCNQALAFIRLSNQYQINLTQIYYYFKSSEIQSQIDSSIVQGVQANVSLTVIKDLKIVIAPNNLLMEFNLEVTQLFNLLQSNRVQNQTLTKLRDTLLPKLISGEVRVKDIEKTIAEAL